MSLLVRIDTDGNNVTMILEKLTFASIVRKNLMRAMIYSSVVPPSENFEGPEDDLPQIDLSE
jgi:hypothetical protein